MSDSTAIAVAKGFCTESVGVGGAKYTVDLEATMDADLDTLCIAVYCTADDLLPRARGNARRGLTDSELVSLCVAQAIMGILKRPPFLEGCRPSGLATCFPHCPRSPGTISTVGAWRTPSNG